MYKVTATRITDTGYATWLTPTLRILNYDGSLLRQVTMDEVWEGNYKYDFEDINTEKLYFFNMDAWTDDVIARLKGATNQIEDATSGFRNVFRQSARTPDFDGIMQRKMEEFFVKLKENESPTMQPIDNTPMIAEMTRIIIDEVNKNKTSIDYNLIGNMIDDKISKIKITEVEDKEEDTSMFDSLKETIKEWIDNIVSKVKPLEEAHTKREQKKQDKLLEQMIEQLAEDIILEDLLLKELNGEHWS